MKCHRNTPAGQDCVMYIYDLRLAPRIIRLVLGFFIALEEWSKGWCVAWSIIISLAR